MEIVLKENEWARDAIASQDLGRNIAETLRRVARYYIDSGLKPAAVKKKTEEFLLSCGTDITAFNVSNLIDDAAKYAAKRPALEIEGIGISQTELAKIDTLDGKQIQRLAFTLLCLAKYKDILKPTNDHWVNIPDTQIMKMANISTSLDRQGLLYWTLREEGLVQFSKKIDSLGTRVLFVDDGEPAMCVKDFRNLGYQYLMHLGEPYFVCNNCGITVKQNKPGVGRKQKYCKECAIKIAIQQRVNAAMSPKQR